MILVRCDSCQELSYNTTAEIRHEQILHCPYHPNWIRMEDQYRTCPEGLYCVRCKTLDRPVWWPHTHGKYQLDRAQLAGVF